MIKHRLLKAHYTPEEACHLLALLDELREVIWHHYRNDIIEHHHQQNTEADIEDDIIPF